MPAKRFAYPVESWGIDSDEKIIKTPDERNLLQCVIGCYGEEPNSPDEYITELIYEDLLVMAQKKRPGSKKKVVTTLTNIQQVPPVLFIYEGELCKHNPDMEKHIENIQKALDQEVQTDILIKGMAELRVMTFNQGEKKGNALKTVESMVRMSTGINYNADLIRYVVQTEVYRYLHKESQISDILSSMKSKELIQFMGDVKEYLLLEETRNKTLSDLIEKFGIQQISAEVNSMIADKYFFGLLEV